MVAVGRQWLPMFLPSFRLTNRVLGASQPQIHQKIQSLSDHISPSIIVGWGRRKYPSCEYRRSKDLCAV